jgi:hypothetical protein
LVELLTIHLNSLSDGQQFHQYQIKKILSPQLIEWWSTIQPISTKITSHLNSLSDGQQFYQYHQKSPLTSTHWVEVIFVDIGGIGDHHSMSWIEGWFLLILVVELLTITQWI